MTESPTRNGSFQLQIINGKFADVVDLERTSTCSIENPHFICKGATIPQSSSI